jgi:hypothetical protein
MAYDEKCRFWFSAAASLTTAFSSGNAYSQDSDVMHGVGGEPTKRGGPGGLPLDPATQLVVICSTAPGTSRDLTVQLKTSIDGGSTWIANASAVIPATKKGRKAVPCGLDLRPELYTAANVDFKVTVSAPASTNVTNAVIQVFLGIREPSDL